MTMEIHSLLNPLSEGQQQKTALDELRPRQNVSRTAAVFVKGTPKKPVRYPPHEGNEDSGLRAEHKRFDIFPLGRIKEYCKHIPYSSDKKTFFEKTGREAFEVFQYEFFVSGVEKENVVMWDYNTGLVRITALFKACKYNKTTPARVINLNPDLRDLTHSITGGSIYAQGYWMPYDTAKAVAATFCYEIRAALTPIFGINFMHECIVPGDPGFGSFKIDRAIIRHSAAQAEAFRLMYSSKSKDRNGSSEGSSPPIDVLSAPPVLRPVLPSNEGRSHNIRSGRGDGKAKTPRRRRRTADSESAYFTDTDRSDRYTQSPESITGQSWISVNDGEQVYTPSPKTFEPQPSSWLSSVPRSLPALPPPSMWPSMMMTPAPETVMGIKRQIEEVEVEEVTYRNDDDVGGVVPVNEKDEAEKHAAEAEVNEEGRQGSEPEYVLVGHNERQPETAEADAALALLMLSGNGDQQAAVDDTHRDKRGRMASV